MRKWKLKNGEMVELSPEEVEKSEPYLSKQFKNLPEMPPGYYIGMTPKEEQMLGIHPRD